MLYCHFYRGAEFFTLRAPISIITIAYCFWPAFRVHSRRLVFVLRKEHTKQAKARVPYLSQISHDITQRPTEKNHRRKRNAETKAEKSSTWNGLA